MQKILLACVAGAVLIGIGGYLGYQSLRQKWTDTADCMQLKDLDRTIAGCTHVIDDQKGGGQIHITINNFDLPNAYLNRGYAYFQQKQHEPARADFEKAITLDPNLAMAYNDLGALEMDKDGDLKKAEGYLNDAIKRDPNLNLAWSNLCLTRERLGEHAEAEEACTRAINMGGKTAKNYVSRGDSYFFRRDLTRAAADYEAALQIDSSYSGAHTGLGNIHANKGEWDAAISEYDAAVNLNGDDAAALSNRCLAYTRKHNLDRAIADCTEAISKDAKNLGAYFNRAGAYLLQDNKDLALADIDAVIKIAPENASAYNDRCNLLREKQDYPSAIASCDKAIALKPDVALPLWNRGRVFYEQSDFTNALADFDAAIHLAPKQAEIYESRSEIHMINGEYDQALEDSNKVLELAPNASVGPAIRGFALFALGNFHDAADDFSASLQRRKFPYDLLWRFLSLQHDGQDGAAKLSDDMSRLDDKSWPYPVMEFYLGRRSADDMSAAASNDDQRCEAAFYLGEWQTLLNNNNDAITLLKKASETCPKTFIESWWAVAELKRLAR